MEKIIHKGSFPTIKNLLLIKLFTLLILSLIVSDLSAQSSCGGSSSWVGPCLSGIDNTTTFAFVTVDFDPIDPACGASLAMTVSGPTTIARQDGMPNVVDAAMNICCNFPLGAATSTIQTEIISMNMTDNPTAPTVTVWAGAGPSPYSGLVLQPTLGTIVEDPGNPFLACSFFDVFFEIGVTLPGAPTFYLYNHIPHKLIATIDQVPPQADIHFPPTGACTDLYDSPIPGTGTLTWQMNGFHAVNPQLPELCEFELGFGINATGIDESFPGAADGSATVLINGGIPPFDIHWSTGETTQTISGLTAGPYWVTVTDDFGCILTALVEIGTGEPCGPGSLVTGLTAIATSSGSGVQLSWDPLPGADLYQAKGRKAGTIPFGQFVTGNTFKNVGGLSVCSPYEWKVRARCEATGDITAFTTLHTFSTACTRIGDLEDITIYPNPVSDRLNVELNLYDKSMVKISIYDLIGKALYSQNSDAIKGLNHFEIDLSEFADGIYFIDIDNGFYVSTHKFNVNR